MLRKNGNHLALLFVVLLCLSIQSIVYGQTSASGYNDAGNATWTRNDMQSALSNYQATSKLEPNNALYHINVGTALNRLFRFSEATVELGKGVELDSSVAWYHNELCVSLTLSASTSKAQPYCEKAIKLDSNNADFQPKLITDLKEGARKQREAILEANLAEERAKNPPRRRDTREPKNQSNCAPEACFCYCHLKKRNICASKRFGNCADGCDYGLEERIV